MAPNGSMWRRGFLLSVTALAAGCGGGVGGESAGAIVSLNSPPVVTTSVGSQLSVTADRVVTFTVTATDPEGDPVSLRLLNPQPGMTAAPLASAASPGTLRVRWLVPSGAGARLLFSANDAAHAGAPVLRTIDVWIRGGPFNSLVRGDVTGDGIPDAIGLAHVADGNGVVDRGAIYVWSGTASPAGSPAPAAVLAVPGAVFDDELGFSSGQTVLLSDVTGDGDLDVVAVASNADVGGVVDTGAIYVWKGGATLAEGATLTGTISPTATLTVPGAAAGDSLGSVSSQAVQLDDVTGDGVPDVVGATRFADAAGVADAGAIYVWKGGATLIGALPPTATLRVPGAVANDQLGLAGGHAVHLGDVTGDGVLDVVGATFFADVAGVVDAGAIYVWKGGATLAGALPPTATLAVPGAVTDDELARASPGLQLGDVTGDGILDVLGAARGADIGGVANTGAIYVWRGGATLAGVVSPTARLTVSGAVVGDLLGFASGFAVQLGDVTDDGTLDVVGAAQLADVGGVVDTGAVYVWKGGPALLGAVPPTATLTVAGATADDELGAVTGGSGFQIGDVTGDGTLDVVGAARTADDGTFVSTGAIYVWKGGPTLLGTVSPTATLRVPDAAANDGLSGASGPGVLLGDVTGDATLDVVGGAAFAEVRGVHFAGAIYVWEGGATLAGVVPPRARLTVPGAVTDDRLGDANGQGVQLGDVTGDGTLDVVGAATFADVGGVVNAGAIYVWAGGATLAGVVPPTATLTVPGAAAGDELGIASVQGVQLGDVTGDGVLDLVAGALFADVGGVVDAGAIYVWKGGGTLAGAAPPTATLTVPGAAASDRLGEATGQAVQLGDVTGDGVLDVVAAASQANVGGVVDAGAIYVWKGGVTLAGTLPPAAELVIPDAFTGDQLGR